MKWNTFWQIALLLIIAGIIFYIVLPKYYFFHIPDDKAKDETNFFRCNTITGGVEITSYFATSGWRQFQK